MPEILPNPFTDPAKLPKRSLFDRGEKDEKQDFIDQAMAQGLEAAKKSVKKEFTDPELQKIWDNIEEKIESGEIKLHEITIGGKSKEQLIGESEIAGVMINEGAKGMMESKDFITSEEDEDMELMDISVAELGLPNGATNETIYHRARELGLKVVPIEVGPQFRLQYPNQPHLEYLFIGSDPIKDSYGVLHIFGVGHDKYQGGYFLGSNIGDPDYWRQGYDRWVFCYK